MELKRQSAKLGLSSVGCDLDKGPETKIEEEGLTYWVAYCRTDGCLMAWSKAHMMPVNDEALDTYRYMKRALVRTADRVYGIGGYTLDFQQRQILDHMHIHARPKPAIEVKSFNSLEAIMA